MKLPTAKEFPKRLLPDPCRTEARSLLKKHGLTAADGVIEMLAVTILKSRRKRLPSSDPTALRSPTSSFTDRLRRAHDHALTLQRFLGKGPPTRSASVESRRQKIRHLLNDARVRCWLELADPPICPADLRYLRAGAVNRLVNALADTKGQRGRPPSDSTKLIRAGYIAWVGSEREASLDGEFAKFLRAFLKCCGINRISCVALRDAITACKNDRLMLSV